MMSCKLTEVSAGRADAISNVSARVDKLAVQISTIVDNGESDVIASADVAGIALRVSGEHHRIAIDSGVVCDIIDPRYRLLRTKSGEILRDKKNNIMLALR